MKSDSIDEVTVHVRLPDGGEGLMSGGGSGTGRGIPRRAETTNHPAEPMFDDLVAMAARLCATPMAIITLVDGRRHRVTAQVGIALPKTPPTCRSVRTRWPAPGW